MQFSNYADFRTKVQNLLDGDDISQSDLSVAVLDTVIGAGEQRLYRVLRSSTQDTALSVSVTSNVATLPSDFLELRGSPYVATNNPAIYAPWEAIQQKIQTGTQTFNHPVYYSFEGDTLIFYPVQDGVTVTGRYYKRFSDISSGLNTLFNRHPDIFLYAALSEACLHFGDSSRLSAYEGKLNSLVAEANEQETRRVSRGSKLTTRIA